MRNQKSAPSLGTAERYGVSNRFKSGTRRFRIFFGHHSWLHTHTMPVVDLNKAIESIDKRCEGLETLVTKALDKEKAVGGLLTCPITYELFVDPVFCAGDGQTYERSAIEEWFKERRTSPLNGLPLKSTKLYPNYHARKLADIRRQGSAPEGRSNELPGSQEQNEAEYRANPTLNGLLQRDREDWNNEESARQVDEENTATDTESDTESLSESSQPHRMEMPSSSGRDENT